MVCDYCNTRADFNNHTLLMINHQNIMTSYTTLLTLECLCRFKQKNTECDNLFAFDPLFIKNDRPKISNKQANDA